MQSSGTTVNSTGVAKLLDSSLVDRIKVFGLEELKEMSENFSDRIGGGGFSSVYRASDGKFPFVIKKYESEASKGFDTEVLNLLRGQHTHVIKLLGISVDYIDNPCVILEFASRGSLDDYLKKRSKMKLNKYEKLKIIIDLSDTLTYLHKRKLVHRDIKPGNILLTTYKQAKFADFNIAQFYGEKEEDRSLYTTTKAMATPDYTCPIWLYTRQCGTFSDIYSLGLTFLVLLSKNIRPHTIINNLEEIIDNKKGKMADLFADNWKEEIQIKLLEIGNICLKYDRKDRPSASQLSSRLRRILRKAVKGDDDDDEDEESRDEKITKLEIKYELLFNKRQKLKNAIVEIKKNIEDIKNYTFKFNIEADDESNPNKSYIRSVQDLRKGKETLMAIAKQCQKLIVGNKVVSTSIISRLAPHEPRGDQCVVFYANFQNKPGHISSVEYEAMKKYFSSFVSKLPNRDHMFICSDIRWFENNFHFLLDLCYQIFLCNIEELELPTTLIFSKNEFKLISNIKTNLKLNNDAKIIICNESKVLFDGMNIVDCKYGEASAILIWENSIFECKRSNIKGNIGNHALIKMIGESKLELEDVTFDNNISTQTMPIILNALKEDGSIKINNCRFLNHHQAKDSMERIYEYIPFLIRAESKEITIQNSHFENNFINNKFSYNLIGLIRTKKESSSANFTVELNDSKFIKCNQSHFYQVDKLSIKNCLFTGNKAYGDDLNGGALSFKECDDLRIEGTDFKENTSESYGGAVSFHDINKITLEKCNFEGNYSIKNGGAIDIIRGQCNMIGCHFKNNNL